VQDRRDFEETQAGNKAANLKSAQAGRRRAERKEAKILNLLARVKNATWTARQARSVRGLLSTAQSSTVSTSIPPRNNPVLGSAGSLSKVQRSLSCCQILFCGGVAFEAESSAQLRSHCV
jgi:hypothetical protein